jgi:acetyl esterase/lipase
VPERPQGVCIEFHAGAWIIGSPGPETTGAPRSPSGARCAVVSVEYRMVPEHLPPAQLEDALST